MAPKGAHIASAAMLYNSRGREPSTRLSGEADHRQNPASPGRQPGGWLNPRAAKDHGRPTKWKALLWAG